MNNLINEIKSKKWFFDVRAEESSFFYSAKYLNREKLNNQYYRSDFVESILLPLKNDQPIRMFNLKQAKKFHLESDIKVLNDPKLVSQFVNLDKKLWKEIDKLSEKLNLEIQKQDYIESLGLFNEIIYKYGEYGNLFFINFSLGRSLTVNQNKIEENIHSSRLRSPKLDKILNNHNNWRNSVVFNEEKLGEVFYYFLNLLIKEKNIKLTPGQIMKYISASELISFMDDKISTDDLIKKVEMRKQNGYVFTFLHEEKYQSVIDDHDSVKEIQDYFLKQLETQLSESNVLKGTSTFAIDEKIKGKVVIIKDKDDLTNIKDVKDKIIVAIQTTPHYMPYLKEVKGIITDEGGITCHAAIVSRELKIPCIVGVKNATSVLKDEQEVEMDTKEEAIIIK